MEAGSAQKVPEAQGKGWKLYRDRPDRIRIDFDGPTETEPLRECIARLEDAMPSHGDMDLLVDLTDVVGHNPNSRDLWTAWLDRHKHRIREVLVVIPSGNPLLKMIAAAVGLAVGIRLRVTNSAD